MANYDIIGNIAIIKFKKNIKLGDKKRIARKFLKEHKNVSTILEKISKFTRRLRTQKTRYLLGQNTKEAIYKENNCVFRLNIDSCYFSPRLASERKEIAEQLKKGENVLVLFGGVAPYAIVMAKLANVNKIISVELSRECNKYAEMNIRLNKVGNKVQITQGDVRKIVEKLNEKFNKIIMPRPNLKDSFLDIAFQKIKKGGIIYYYDFFHEKDKDKLKELILNEAKKAKKQIKILRIKKAGEIGAYKFRYRVDIKLLN